MWTMARALRFAGCAAALILGFVGVIVLILALEKPEQQSQAPSNPATQTVATGTTETTPTPRTPKYLDVTLDSSGRPYDEPLRRGAATASATEASLSRRLRRLGGPRRDRALDGRRALAPRLSGG